MKKKKKRIPTLKAGVVRKVVRKIVIPVAEVPKPLPRTVEEAWDAMKAAKELPQCYRSASVPPAKLSGATYCNVQQSDGKIPSTESFLKERVNRKKECSHRRDNGTLNIKWMEHSHFQILGVCGQCFSQFDTRNPADNLFFQEDIKAQRNMGHAGMHCQFSPPTFSTPESRWKKIKNFVFRLFNPSYDTRFKKGKNSFGQDCLVPR